MAVLARRFVWLLALGPASRVDCGEVDVDKPIASALEMHVRRFFEGHEVHFHTWPGPVEKRLPGFRVMVIAPGPRTDLWVYMSVGASQVREGEHGWEFFVLAKAPNDAHVELVTMTAFYNANPDQSYRLGVGHVVPIGRPWLPGSQCSRLLVSLPYPFGPELEKFSDTEGHVQILWLLPITEPEREFLLKNGLDALEERFEEFGLEYWVPNRVSII